MKTIAELKAENRIPFKKRSSNPKKVSLCDHCGGNIAIANPTGKCSHVYYPNNCPVCFKKHGYIPIDKVEKYKKSLSQKIASDVAGCKNKVRDYGSIKDLLTLKNSCKDVPPEQKCPGCKRLLKFKKENLV